MKMLRVGIVASGMMARNHTDALRRIPGVEVVAIADPCSKNLEEIASSLGIPHVFSNYKDMCDQMKLDVLHNCTPNSEHYEINQYAITHNIGIYSEKPLAVTVKEAESLTSLLKEHKVPNGVNFNYRSNAMVREMRSRIRRGEAGRPLLVHGGYLQDWLMYETDFNWRLDSSKGGASRTVADIGSHWFDTVQTILDSKITEVYAHLETVYPERLKPKQEIETFASTGAGVSYERVAVDTEDMGFILVKFENGIVGNVVLSQVSGGYKNDMRISVDCAKCSLRWEQQEADHLVVGDREHGETKLYAAAGNMSDDVNYYATLPGGHPAGWADALRNNIRLFYDSIIRKSYQADKQEYATFADAAYIMKIVEACLESNKRNNWVEI